MRLQLEATCTESSNGSWLRVILCRSRHPVSIAGLVLDEKVRYEKWRVGEAIASVGTRTA